LQLLGDHYTQRGLYSEGLKVDERLARLEPKSPLVFYNLACSYSLTDQFDRAVMALERAIQLGYSDFKWLVKDPDLKKLRAHPAFSEIKSHIRAMKSKPR
jgi:tetratricopeptide (TPR) repeat protein